MRGRDLLVRSGDSLRSAKTRTALTTLAIGVGAFAMTLGLSLNSGGREYADKILTANIDNHSLWVMKKQDQNSTPLHPSHYTDTPAIWFNKMSVTPITKDDADHIAAVEGVESVDPVFVIDNAIIARKANTDQYQAIVNVAREGAHRTYLAGEDTALKDDEIILPDGYRQALGFATPASALGQQVQITVMRGVAPKTTKKTVSYTVRGVIQRSSLSLSVAPMAVLISTNAAKTLNDYIVKGTANEGHSIAGTAKVSPNEDPETVKQRIIDAGYFAQTPSDVYSAMYQFVGVLRFTLIIFSIIAVLTAIFGIINTQYISVLERTQEIGLMKAVGMSRKSIKKLFEIETGMMGFIGSTIGALLAISIGSALNPTVTLLLGLDNDMMLMHFNMLDALGVVALLTVTALLAGLLPAKRAANLDPIEALHDDAL